MEKSYFFNSAPGDPRTYQAEDFANYFGSVLSTGLLHTNQVPGMSVSVSTGTLNTVVTAGKAMITGHMYENTASLTLAHAMPEASLNRRDRIVLRLDLRNAERSILVKVKQGVAATTPVAPALQRDNFIYEISLAQILVRANTAQLLQSDLTDERLVESLCGLVYSLISIPTSQFQSQWDAFMSGLQGASYATQASLNSHAANTSHVPYAPDTGSANGKLVTLSPVPTSYVDGMAFAFKNQTLNTAAVTVNVNNLGSKNIVKSNGNAISAGNLKAGSIYTVRYSLTTGNFILQGEGGEYGTATAGQVRAGTTIGTDAGLVSGTLAVQATGPQTVTPTGSNIVKPAGIYDGDITVAGVYVPAANVLSGTTIAGTAGTMPSYGSQSLGAVAVAADGGGGIYLNGPAGHYQTSTSISTWDGDFIPSNIRQNTSIFGVTGSLEPRKRAEGSGTLSGSHTLIFMDGGSLTGVPTASVYGLNFVPIWIRIWISDEYYVTIAGQPDNAIFCGFKVGNYMYAVNFNNNQWMNQATGTFTLPCGGYNMAGTTFYWVAEGP